MIDHRDLETCLQGEGSERAGVIAGAEDVQVGRRIEDLDEEARIAHLFDAGVFRFDPAARNGERVPAGVEAALDLPARDGERPSLVRSGEEGAEAETNVLRAERSGRAARIAQELRTRALNEHLDRALAAEAHPPDGFFVGARLVAEQARLTGLDRLQGVGADVALEASAAHAASRVAVLLDEKLGAGAAIGGAVDSDDGGEGGVAAGFGDPRQPIEDRTRLAPMLQPARPPPGSVCKALRL